MDASKGRLEYWIEKERLLPDTDFCFSEPKCMAAEDVILLASWIIKGELGLLEENKRFRWVGQADISLPPNVPHGSAKYVFLYIVIFNYFNIYLDEKILRTVQLLYKGMQRMHHMMPLRSRRRQAAMGRPLHQSTYANILGPGDIILTSSIYSMTSGVSKASSVTEEVLQKPPNKTRMTAAKRKIESSLDVSKPSPIAKKHKKLRASDQEREQVRGSECFDLDISSSSDTDLDMERYVCL